MNVSLLQSIVFHVPKNAADDRQPAFFSPSAAVSRNELPYFFDASPPARIITRLFMTRVHDDMPEKTTSSELSS